MTNLRPQSPGSPILMPATPAAYIRIPQGWHPVAVLDGNILATSGLDIAFITPQGRPATQATLPAPPRCAALAAGTLVVMTDLRPCLFKVDTDTLALTPVQSSAATPGHLRVDSAAPVSVTVPAAPISKIRDTATDAVRNLDAAVRAQGLLWQPVIAWLRAIDSRGKTIATTAPALITPPGGSVFAQSIPFYSSDGGATTLRSTIETPAWKLTAVPDSDFAAAHPDATVEIMSSPFLYGFGLGTRASVTPRMRADDTAYCHVTLAPSALSLIPAPSPATLPTIAALIARADTLCSPLASSTLNADVSALRAAMRRAIFRASYSEVILSPPHSFTAGACASSSRAVLWSGLSATRAPAPDASTLALDFTDASWHAAVKVSFADGSSLVSVSQSTSAAPARFGPVLSYPSPDAVSISITLKTAGQPVRAGTFSLAPDPSGRNAIYVHPSLMPFTLPDEIDTFTIPPQAPASVPLPDTVAAAPVDDPLVPGATSVLSSGTVNALAEAAFSQSPWDFGRSRFYAFTSAGIRLVNIDLSRRAISTSLIDPRVVSGPAAIAVAEGAIAAIASGDLVLIAGSKISRVAVPDEIPGAQSIAWNHADHELWVIAPSSTLVIPLDNPSARYNMSETFNPALSLSPCLVDNEGYCRLASHPDTALSIDISLQTTVSYAIPRSGPATLTLDATGRFTPLTITVTRTVLDTTTLDTTALDTNAAPAPDTIAAPAPDATITIRGPLRSPLRRTIHHLTARHLAITLTATTTPATRLHPPTLS